MHILVCLLDVPLLKRGDNRPEALLVWSPSAHILDAKCKYE